jgi:hypothetical protein
MNTPVFHEIVSGIISSVKLASEKLRPKINIFVKELNAKLDANGRYTKKIFYATLGLLFFIMINRHKGNEGHEKKGNRTFTSSLSGKGTNI